MSAARPTAPRDFRTWHATALAVSTHASRSRTASKRAVARAVKEVARYLGNTPAVCRRSYIDPRVPDAYLDGRTIAEPLEELALAGDASSFSLQEAIERSAFDLLAGANGGAAGRQGKSLGAADGESSRAAPTAAATACPAAVPRGDDEKAAAA